MKVFALFLAFSIMEAQTITIRTHQGVEKQSSTTDLDSSSQISSFGQNNHEDYLHQRWWFWGGRRHERVYELF